MSAMIETQATDAGASDALELPLATIASYVAQGAVATEATLDRARVVLLGALADLFLALNQSEAMRAVRALLPGNIQPGGARVPGTSYELEPHAAATAIGMLVSWGIDAPIHSPLRVDSLGSVLAVADALDRKRAWRGVPPLTVRELLHVLIKAEGARRMLEQSASSAMTGAHCLLGATTVATLSLLSCDVARIEEALRRVSTLGDALLPTFHAEAVRVAFDVDGPNSPAMAQSVVACDAFPVAVIPACASHERSVVVQRFESAVQTRLPLKQCERIKAIVADHGVFDGMAVNAFMAELVANQA